MIPMMAVITVPTVAIIGPIVTIIPIWSVIGIPVWIVVSVRVIPIIPRKSEPNSN